MCQSCSSQSPGAAPQKATRWLAVVLSTVTVAWTAAMVASLRWHFLDPFVAGITNNPLALDFFQFPCAFKNLLVGNSIYLTEVCDYASFGTPYYNHPLTAIAVGPWTAPFAPWTAYGLFMIVSLVFLAFSAWLLASALENPTAKAFAFFALFCSLPTYFMLWSGQIHVLVVVAVSLILAGLMRLSQNPDSSKLYLRWIQAGILISLFSKPTVLLMLPVLFLLPETRRKVLVPVAIYAAVSLLFLLVPRLNPGGYNATHWLNLFHASLSPKHVYRLATPMELDYSTSGIVYSLPRLLLGVCNRSTLSVIVAIPLLSVLTMSLSPLVISERVHRIRAAVVTVSLCILSHYLCYFIALEYHYVAMLPVLPALLWLRGGEENRRLRWLLTVALLAASCVLLPTFNVFSGKTPDTYWRLCALLRVVPVLVAFVFLTVYGITLTRLYTHGTLREYGRQIVAQFREAERPAAAIGILLVAVFSTAFATVPDRLLTPPSIWTQDTWNEHFEDIVSRPGIKPKDLGILHYNLAMTYAAEKPALALEHYAAAYRLTPDHTLDRTLLTLEMSEAFLAGHHKDLAVKLLATLSSDKISEPLLHKKLLELRESAGMNDPKKRVGN